LIVRTATVFIILSLSNRLLIREVCFLVLIITHLGDGDKCLAMWLQEGQHELNVFTLPFQEFQGFF